MFKKSDNQGWSKEAMIHLSRATQGNPESQYELALLLLEGNHVPKDEKLAVEWLRKSVTQGNEDAQYLLGTCYDSGTGVPMDEKIARGLYLKSAEAANRYAQFKIGLYYFSLKHYSDAVEWYKKAAKQEHPQAQVELARCYYYGLGPYKSAEAALIAMERAVARKYPPALKFKAKIEEEM